MTSYDILPTPHKALLPDLIDNGMQFLLMGLAVIASRRSRTWNGYWRRHRRAATQGS